MDFDFESAFPILLIVLWEYVWKVIALWKASKNNQKAWFICLAVFNTIGILPMLYIFAFQKKK